MDLAALLSEFRNSDFTIYPYVTLTGRSALEGRFHHKIFLEMPAPQCHFQEIH